MVAPILAALAPAAMSAVERLLDKVIPDPEVKAKALLEIKKEENQQILAEMQIALQTAQIDAADRASARQREASMAASGQRDYMPMFLCIVVTSGFFGVLFWLLNYGAPEKGGEVLYIMLGALGTSWGGIVQYYFGSSAGSDKKTAMVAGLAK